MYGRSFAAKDEIFCLFEGALHNLGSLNQHYGLSKRANESVLVIEAYRALRDRAPHPTNHVIGHLDGDFSFIIFDKSTSTLLVASVRILFILHPNCDFKSYKILYSVYILHLSLYNMMLFDVSLSFNVSLPSKFSESNFAILIRYKFKSRRKFNSIS